MPQLGSRKSRKGCLRCRQRRVKCDEQIPCGTCVRRHEECSLLASTSSNVSDTNDSEHNANLSLPSNSTEWTSDLELMYHCTTNHSYLGARQKVVHVWHVYVPQKALKHPFLMHGLLAFAALHLAYLRPNRSMQYLQMCDKHQRVALRDFRSIMSAPIGPELGESLLALAATLSLSSTARSCAFSTTGTMSMDTVAEQFNLTRGIANVTRLTRAHILQGPLAEMLKDHTYPRDTGFYLPTATAARFESLREMLSSYAPDQDGLKYCHSALTELEETYKTIAYLSRTEDIETEVLSRWQILVPIEYIRLVQVHNPPALIILAYYAAAVTTIRATWYFQNWAEYVLQGISQRLESDVKQWIVWPMQQIQDRMSELVHAPSEDVA